jgi:hypothetical protein
MQKDYYGTVLVPACSSGRVQDVVDYNGPWLGVNSYVRRGSTNDGGQPVVRSKLADVIV